MKQDEFLNVLYDMALVIGGETHVKPLINKTLDRFLHHTSLPCGFFISEINQNNLVENVNGITMAQGCLEVAIGNSRLMNLLGSTISFPDQLLKDGAACVCETVGLESIFAGESPYPFMLRLPAPEVGIFFLCMADNLPEDFPEIDLFDPVLANFSKTYGLCRTNAESILRFGRHIDKYKRLAEKNERREGYLRVILDNVVDGIITMDGSSIIQSYNPAAEKIFGFSVEEAVGQKMTMLMPEPLRDWHDQYIDQFLAVGDRDIIGIPLELIGQRKNGKHFPMSIAVGRLPYERQTLFTAIIRDITRSKQVEEALKKSEQRLKEAQRIGHIGDWSLDIRSGKLQWSDEIFRIFGHQPGDFTPTPERFFDAVHPDDVAKVGASEQRAFLNHGKDSIDHRIVLPSGEIRWVHEEAESLFDEAGEAVYLVGTVHDITEGKRVEAEALKAKEDAENANKAKSEFLSRMSHELRTPLNAILGFTQVLEIKGGLDEKTSQIVREIHTAGDHLLELINEVLDLASIEAGHIKLKMENVQLEIVLDECLAIIKTLAAKKNISIDVQLQICNDAVVFADRMRLKQVLLNLLSNAVKYNSDNGSLQVDCVSLDGGRTRISVSDTGAGIAAENYAELFEPFSRLGAEKTNIQGTGIGLALSKSLTESMGGEIGFQSAIGQGSTFWLELMQSSSGKFIQDEDVGGNVVVQQAQLSGSYTLLYIEDNLANVRLVEQLVANTSYLKLIDVGSAELGLEMLETHRPDLILLDIQLPGMDGFEAMEELQKNQDTCDIPVIALSANAMVNDLEKGHQAGFRDYLTKPVNVERFYQAINSVLAAAADSTIEH